jgi:hypothetical protein
VDGKTGRFTQQQGLQVDVHGILLPWFTRIFLLLVIAILDPNVDSPGGQTRRQFITFFVAGRL